MESSVPRIVIIKHKRKLQLFKGDELAREFSVVLGFAPEGTKEVEGDGRTPEGNFYVFTKNPKSKFHRSLGISYPGANDAARGLEQNLISGEDFEMISTAIADGKMPPQKTALGGEIYIHGGGIGGDWTDGCVGLNDDEMSELFALVAVGTQVTIFP